MAEMLQLDCPVCGGSGILYRQVDPNGKKVAFECECLKAANLKKRMSLARIPHEFQNLTLPPDLLVTAGTGEYEVPVDPAEFLQRFRDGLDENIKERMAMEFLGSNGTGKTLFATLLQKEALRQGKTSFYLLFSEYLDLAWEKKTAPNIDLEDVLGCDLLVIDEMGKGSDHEAVLGEIEELVRTRTSHSGVTIFISNLDDQPADGERAKCQTDRQRVSLNSTVSLKNQILTLNFGGIDYRTLRDPLAHFNRLMGRR